MYCRKCGEKIPDDSNYCGKCGAQVMENDGSDGQEYYYNPQGSGDCSYNGNNSYGDYSYHGRTFNTRGIEPRNIAFAVIVSILTCGIYSLYWIVRLNEDINTIVEDYEAPTGVFVIVISIITCGIYLLFWYYQMGKKVDEIEYQSSGNYAILFLILGIFGFGIVNWCIMQNSVNKAVERKM